MRIAILQIDVIPGNPEANYKNIESYVHNIIKGELAGHFPFTDMIVIPELALSGYLIGDLVEERAFVEDCMYYGDKIKKLSMYGKIIVWGNLTYDVDEDEIYTHTDGRKCLYNAAFVYLNNQSLLPTEFQKKALLPNYREFEEPRHFTPMSTHEKFNTIRLNNGVNFGVIICEDGWDKDYDRKPITELRNCDLVVNISCSPFTIGKNNSRNRVFGQHAIDNNLSIIYANSVGCQNNGKTVYTFDGSSVCYNNVGKVVNQAPMFKSTIMFVEFDKETGFTPAKEYPYPEYSDISQIYESIVYGIKQYCKQSGIKRVVIGASGGMDSALAAALYVTALGSDNVMLINMPSEFNSKTTIDLAEKLACNLQCYYTKIPISDSVKLTKKQINKLMVIRNDGEYEKSVQLKLSDFNLENVQARDRSSRILAAVSSAWGAVFTNNGNKSEMTVGYCTMMGDHAGFLCAIGDLWKTQVYELASYVNLLNNADIIPQQVFIIKPSAELSKEQSVDEGKGDPIIYPYHDKLFSAWVERWNRLNIEDIIYAYHENTLDELLGITDDAHSPYTLFQSPVDFVNDLERWWKLFKGMGVVKRVQAPPVLAVSRRCFGFDYRESTGCIHFSKKYLDYKEFVCAPGKPIPMKYVGPEEPT